MKLNTKKEIEASWNVNSVTNDADDMIYNMTKVMEEKTNEQEIVCEYSIPTDDTEYPISPYIHLADPKDDLEMMENPGEIIIKEKVIQVAFRYPFNKEYIFTFVNHKNKKGWTRLYLTQTIVNQYKRMYKDETIAAGDPGYIPGMYNRAPSKGPYGIWGHYLEDLVLDSILKRQADGVYELGISS